MTPGRWKWEETECGVDDSTSVEGVRIYQPALGSTRTEERSNEAQRKL